MTGHVFASCNLVIEVLVGPFGIEESIVDVQERAQRLALEMRPNLGRVLGAPRVTGLRVEWSNSKESENGEQEVK